MAYATAEQFRAYLKQVPATADSTSLIEAVLERASAIIDGEVGGSFAVGGAAAARTFYGDGTDYLAVAPYVAGSLAGVSAATTVTVPDYVEVDGHLVVVDGDGRVAQRRPSGLLADRSGLRPWLEGVPYTVTASWGYSAVPADITEACLEIAARIWRGRDAGFSDVIGVEGGGAVGYEKALPALVRRILDRYRERLSLGVY